MPVYKCKDCGFKKRYPEKPKDCPNCDVQGIEKKGGFEEIPDETPDKDVSKRSEYHWHCLTCGFKHSGQKKPGKCPNCDAQGEESKGFQPISPEGRMSNEVEKRERIEEEELEKNGEISPPNMNWTKGEIIAFLQKHYNVQTWELDGGMVIPIEECVHKSQPTKQMLLKRYLEVTGQA